MSGIPDPTPKFNRDVLIYNGTEWIASRVDWSELTGKPATFAPTIHGDSAHDATVASLDGSGLVPASELASGAPAAGEFLAGSTRDWRAVAYAELSGTPSEFAPSDHKANHVVGGGDAFAAGDLLDATGRVIVRKNTGADIGARRRLNLIEGTNVTLTVADDSANEEIDVTIAASGGGGAGYFALNMVNDQVWTNMPAGATNFAGTQAVPIWRLDLAAFADIRFQIGLRTAGFSGADIFLEYSTDNSTYNAVTGATLDITTVGFLDTGWLAMPAGMIADNIYVRLRGINGDGVVDPNFTQISAYFRT